MHKNNLNKIAINIFLLIVVSFPNKNNCWRLNNFFNPEKEVIFLLKY